MDESKQLRPGQRVGKPEALLTGVREGGGGGNCVGLFVCIIESVGVKRTTKCLPACLPQWAGFLEMHDACSQFA